MVFKMNRMRCLGAAAITLACIGLFVGGAAGADDKRTLKAVVHADL